MSNGTGNSSRRWDMEDTNGTRIVWGSCGNPIQIRSFRLNAKINEPADVWNLSYDSNYNLTNILVSTKTEYVNNLDIRVPEKPIIVSSTPASPNSSLNPIINGTIIGTIVKDGDLITIYDANTNKQLGQGTVLANAFSVAIDLSAYPIGIINLFAICSNEKIKYNGGSERSLHYTYEII
jgi:hypothetical protein